MDVLTKQSANGHPNRLGSIQWTEPRPEAAMRLGAYLDRLAARPEMQAVVACTLELLDLRPGQCVLDAGCGRGGLLPAFARAVGTTGRVVGVDHSPEFVAAARERVALSGFARSVALWEGDVRELPFGSASLDAAHCERLLLHVEDPTAVLREMRRVVRPGGRVVAVEPHWRGVQLDHPDRRAMDLLVGRWLAGLRHPGIGLELNRRMADAGLVDRRVVAVPVYHTDFRPFLEYGLELETAAAELIWDREMSAERARAALEHLEDASRKKSFYGSLTMFLALGRVPAGKGPGEA